MVLPTIEFASAEMAGSCWMATEEEQVGRLSAGKGLTGLRVLSRPFVLDLVSV